MTLLDMMIVSCIEQPQIIASSDGEGEEKEKEKEEETRYFIISRK